MEMGRDGHQTKSGQKRVVVSCQNALFMFYQGGLGGLSSSGWSVINDQGGLSSRWSVINDQGGVSSSGWSVVKVVCHQ